MQTRKPNLVLIQIPATVISISPCGDVLTPHTTLSSWQQYKIEPSQMSHRAHSISACSRYLYMDVVLHAHFICGESHIQHNTNQEVPILAKSLG